MEIVDFVNTQTSIPTAEDIQRAEMLVGYSLPDGPFSIKGDSLEETVAYHVLLHPALFKKLANTEVAS